MGKVIPFQRPRPRRPGPAKPRQGAGEKGCWAWWLVGAAAAAVAAILSPLLWPARIGVRGAMEQGSQLSRYQ
ncbi:hypothetical protein B7L66_25030 (plasmid) [Xanthomonas citri pv. citri]|nr:hypothetical protein B7L66_25030 [Xanthomonas citri pv. citri]